MNTRILKLILLLFGCLVSIVGQCMPNINVGSMYQYIDDSSGVSVKKIYNSGTSVAYVRVSVSEIKYINGEAKYYPIEETDLRSREIIVSPSRLIIPPGLIQAVRLFYKGSRDQERYYRVSFVPVLPEDGSEFNISDTEMALYKAGLSTGVKVIAGYGVLLIVRPKNVVFNSFVTDGSKVEITNSGNSTIELDHVSYCHKKNSCEKSQKFYLKPGSKKVFEKKVGYQIKFDLIEGGKHTKYVF